jgi:hypothetical protein
MHGSPRSRPIDRFARSERSPAGPDPRARVTAVLAALLLALTSGCAGGPGAYDVGDQPTDAAARFVSPQDGDAVTSPLLVVLEADGIDLVPCGPAVECEGHLNILVDRPCVTAGELVPAASAGAVERGVIALNDGTDRRTIELAPGEHTLCAQLSDGTQLAFGATETITVTVVP